jgi:hypothetical protein
MIASFSLGTFDGAGPHSVTPILLLSDLIGKCLGKLPPSFADLVCRGRNFVSWSQKNAS